jgi:glutamyl-tRNA reductase
LGSLQVLPTLAALRAHATEIAEQVVQENAGKWESASDGDLERVDALAKAVVNRLLHDPTMQIREMRDDRVHARMALIRDLFALEVDEPVLDPEQVQQLAEVRELQPRTARSHRRV